MTRIERIGGCTSDCYLHEGPAIRVMEAGQYQEFISRQRREVMANCGAVNPEDIDAYVRSGGFNGLKAAATTMTPENVVEQVKRSGLRDRSAQGRPTGAAWGAYRSIQHLPRYLISSRLGGYAEAWMERTLIEGNPFALIEGMAIAAYAMGGVEKGIVYLPSAYKPLAFRRMTRAIQSAQARRFLGRNILGTPFSFDLEIREALGEDALPRESNPLVCGECGRALFDLGESENYEDFKNLEAWPKPFYVNNAETYATLPLILYKGADWFSSLGIKNGTGTKVFALTGKTKHPCLVEAPIGCTLADLMKMAGGEKSRMESPLKAFQVGGPQGGIFPASFESTPLDFDSLAHIGWKIGSGYIVLMDEKVCMVEMVRYSLSQLAAETCAGCQPCSKAVRNLLAILNRLVKGLGEEGDLDTLEIVASRMEAQARCAFGKEAVTPVRTALRYFRSEFQSHLRKRCPAHSCRDLGTGEPRMRLAA